MRRRRGEPGDAELLYGTVTNTSTPGQVTVDVNGVEMVALVSTQTRPILVTVGRHTVLVPYPVAE